MRDVVFFVLIISIIVIVRSIIYWPTELFLKDAVRHTPDSFQKQYPNKRWTLYVYIMFAIPVGIAAFWLAYSVFNTVEGVIHQGYLGLYSMLGTALLFDGLFELITAVVPAEGIVWRGWVRQEYIYHPRARRVGLLRIILTLAGYVGYFGVYWLLRDVIS